MQHVEDLFRSSREAKTRNPFLKKPSCERLCFQLLTSADRRSPCKIKMPRPLVFFLNKIYLTYMQVIACEKFSKFLTQQMHEDYDD